jgi:hypothetical protein
VGQRCLGTSVRSCSGVVPVRRMRPLRSVGGRRAPAGWRVGRRGAGEGLSVADVVHAGGVGVDELLPFEDAGVEGDGEDAEPVVGDVGVAQLAKLVHEVPVGACPSGPRRR